MIIGIRVESENIQTGAIKHCNSSISQWFQRQRWKNEKSQALFFLV
jgi:hypothetical protein